MAKVYQCTAINAEGRTVQESIEAESESQAKSLLFARGFMVTAIHAAGGRGGAGVSLDFSGQGTKLKSVFGGLFDRGVPTGELILFTKQFRTLFSAGIPLVDIFQILQEQTERPQFARVIGDIHQRVREGQSLQLAFGAHPKIFSPLYCSMISAGEASGSMPNVLERLVYLLDHDEKVKKQITSAVRYPKIVLGVMLIAFLVLLNFVIPQFASLYATAKIELPLPTRIAMGLNYLMSTYWWLCLIIGAGVYVGLKLFFASPTGTYLWDRYSLKIPVVGSVVVKAVLARFAAIFGILQRSGVPILDSMDILKNTVDNEHFRRQFDLVKSRLSSGDGVADSLRSIDGFSALAISLVTVGERSSNLDLMMDEMRSHYDEEVDLAVERLNEYLGPVLILCLGVVVLFFALAIFLPMWDMVKFVN